jgi:hypothetical protein
MARQPKQYDDDDGRVICNMDVEGMRWHDKRVRREEKAAARDAARGDQMTRAEARKYTWYSMLAGLLIASVFSVAWVLFTLFCTQIWFR